MANQELEIVIKNEKPVIAQLKNIISKREVNRRAFMAGLGLTGAAAGAGLMTGCSSYNPQVVTAAGPAQSDVLNFALNLEYLEATFYSYITQGTDLPSSATGGFGTITGAPTAKLAFTGTSAQLVTDLLNEIYYDELNHVLALRSVLGSAAVNRPNLYLAGTGTTAPTASVALTLARQLEDVGVTAYAGAAALLTGANLTYAAQILAVEAFHAGALRYMTIEQNSFGTTNVVGGPIAIALADTYDVRPSDPGTAALAAAGPTPSTTTTGGGFFATDSAAISSVTSPGFAFTRSTSQVLNIVYGTVQGTIGSFQGAFFPKGMNGLITVS